MNNVLPFILAGGKGIKDGALWVYSQFLKDDEAKKRGQGIIDTGQGIYDKLMDYYKYMFLTKSLKDNERKKPAKRNSYIRRRRISKPTYAYRNKKKKYWSPSRYRRISYRNKPRKRGGHNARLSTMGTLLFLDAMKKKENVGGSGLSGSTVLKQMDENGKMKDA